MASSGDPYSRSRMVEFLPPHHPRVGHQTVTKSAGETASVGRPARSAAAGLGEAGRKALGRWRIG